MNSEWAEPLGLDNPKHLIAAVPVANAGAVMEPCAGRKAVFRDGMRMVMRTARAFGSDGGAGREGL
ncbi:MAG: hypothetical protein GX174_07420 [Lentisphaerae bacterium]|jgi:hypothetical protein|nr:hypothetical protein [Lentisphaerota bacterium]